MSENTFYSRGGKVVSKEEAERFDAFNRPVSAEPIDGSMPLDEHPHLDDPEYLTAASKLLKAHSFHALAALVDWKVSDIQSKQEAVRIEKEQSAPKENHLT